MSDDKRARPERIMVKCYYFSGRANARCVGFIKDHYTVTVGTVRPFEQWHLLPRGFNPRTRSRSRITEVSRRAYGASMRASTEEMQGIGARFFPTPVFFGGMVRGNV